MARDRAPKVRHSMRQSAAPSALGLCAPLNPGLTAGAIFFRLFEALRRIFRRTAATIIPGPKGRHLIGPAVRPGLEWPGIERRRRGTRFQPMRQSAAPSALGLCTPLNPGLTAGAIFFRLFEALLWMSRRTAATIIPSPKGRHLIGPAVRPGLESPGIERRRRGTQSNLCGKVPRLRRSIHPPPQQEPGEKCGLGPMLFI